MDNVYFACKEITGPKPEKGVQKIPQNSCTRNSYSYNSRGVFLYLLWISVACLQNDCV